jgi:hypothetical protein
MAAMMAPAMVTLVRVAMVPAEGGQGGAVRNTKA